MKSRAVLFAAVIVPLTVGTSGCSTPAPYNDPESALVNSTEVKRFGEAAAAHATVDVATATTLLMNLFDPRTSVTGEVSPNNGTTMYDPKLGIVRPGNDHLIGVRQVSAHAVRRQAGGPAIDKRTGARYESPQFAVRDPVTHPTPAALSPAATYSGRSDPRTGGVSYLFSEDGEQGYLDVGIQPDLLRADGRTVIDVYAIASLGITGTPDKAAVYHFAGSLTFGLDDRGLVSLLGVTYPNQLSIAIKDQVLRVPYS